MTSIIQSINRLRQHMAFVESIPELDGSSSARLVTMRVKREKTLHQSAVRPEKELRPTFGHVHPSSHQIDNEKLFTSWFLKGQDFYRPNWCVDSRNSDVEYDLVDKACRNAALPDVASDQTTLEDMLEKIDSYWQQAGAPKDFTDQEKQFWCSDWNESLEHRTDPKRKNLCS